MQRKQPVLTAVTCALREPAIIRQPDFVVCKTWIRSKQTLNKVVPYFEFSSAVLCVKRVISTQRPQRNAEIVFQFRARLSIRNSRSDPLYFDLLLDCGLGVEYDFDSAR